MHKDFPELSVAEYLNHKEYDLEEGENRINAPFREDADSESFCTSGSVWYDHSYGKGGNTWMLAIEMNDGDRRAARKDYYAAAGLPLPAGSLAEDQEKRFKAEDALDKVRERYAINADTDQKVLDYLAARSITDKSWSHLAYIPPEDDLEDILSSDEIDLTGLQYRKGKIILWYFENGRPVYYCTRDMDSKEFKKAPADHMHHPIWNVDALYKSEDVVWCEGFFDALSLMELGYQVAGEITCNLIGKHQQELLRALRFRSKHFPDSKFVICLDNDEPDKDGRRPGNEAAEKIAMLTLEAGCSACWVKHDPADKKEDINSLHVEGREREIHRMIDGARPVMDVLTTDPDKLQSFIVASLNAGNPRQAAALLERAGDLKDASGIKGLTAILRTTMAEKSSWNEFYDDSKVDISFWADRYLVRYKKMRGSASDHVFISSKSDLIRHLAPVQKNKGLNMAKFELDIPVREPHWRVSKNPWKDDGERANLFRPSPYLLQKPLGAAPEIPPMWNLILDNLAGEEEREWLLNHMAVYVQTLEKPQTIPVLYGAQGTGKNTLAMFFAKGVGIGSYASVDKEKIESQFNDWLVNCVVLADEIYTRRSEVNRHGALMKPLVNESIRVNAKYAQPYQAELNNYILVASNRHPGVVPVPVEQGDRRYSIITGGGDRNLAHVPEFEYDQLNEELPGLMLHLLSRQIDVEKAAVPLDNEPRRRMMDMAEDPVVGLLREYIPLMRKKGKMCTMLEFLSTVNHRGKQDGHIEYDISQKSIRDYLLAAGVEPFRKNGQWWLRDMSADTEHLWSCNRKDEESSGSDDEASPPLFK